MILTLLGDSYLFLTLVSGIDKMCDAYRKEIIKFNKKTQIRLMLQKLIKLRVDSVRYSYTQILDYLRRLYHVIIAKK